MQAVYARACHTVVCKSPESIYELHARSIIEFNRCLVISDLRGCITRSRDCVGALCNLEIGTHSQDCVITLRNLEIA